MFKNIVAPVQAWLLASGKCVGCGTLLYRGEREKREKGLEKVICKCGRIYMYNSKTKRYRRALFEEV